MSDKKDNKWSSEGILDTVGDLEELTTWYPDNLSGTKCDWYLVVIDKLHEAACLAALAACQGWVVGVWATTFGNFAVGVYCPDEEIQRLTSDFTVSELCMGADRIVELGKEPERTPMLMARNWGNGKVND